MALLQHPHHPFDAWIRGKGKTRAWASVRLQTTKASLSRIINGKQWPGPEFFERVESLTGGQITAAHFVNPKRSISPPKALGEPDNNLRIAKREKTRVRVLIDKSLVAEATDLGLDLDAFADEALREGIKRERVRRWQADHADVIAWYNDHVEKNGIFGEEWRTF